MSLGSVRARRFAAIAVPLAITSALGVATLSPAAAEVDRTSYRGSNPGVEVTFPTDWIVAEQASYPGLLVAAYDPRPGAGGVRLGGRMTLTVEQLRPEETLRACAERNRLLLGKLGYSPQPLGQHPTGAILLQAATPDGKRVVRQAYRRFDRDETLVFVLTLAAPRDVMQRYVRAFDDTLRGLIRLADNRPAAAASPDDADPDAPTPGAFAPPPEATPAPAPPPAPAK